MNVSQSTPTELRLLTPDELAALVPSRRKGRKTSAQTIRRWMFEGLKGRFLRYTRVGALPCSSETALMEFFHELTIDDENRRFHQSESGHAPCKSLPDKLLSVRTDHFNKIAESLGL